VADTLIIGLGNPILGDDGVGWKVAERVRQRLESGAGDLRDLSDVDVNCVSLGGLSLMEQMVGYERAIVVDSMQTGQGEAGDVRIFKLEEMQNPFLGHSASTHDTSLIIALETGRKMGLKLPDEVIIVAVEAIRVYDFSEELSLPIASAVPRLVEAVLGAII